MTQQELLEKTAQELRAVLSTLRQDFSHLDEKTLQQRNNIPKSWNMLECFEHLNLHYNDYLVPIELAIHKAKARKRTFRADAPVGHSWLANMALRQMRAPAGKRYRTGKRYNPLGRPLSASAYKSLIINIEKLLRIVQMSREVDINRTKIRFAIVPMFSFSLANLLEILSAHTQRHVEQARNLFT